MSSGNLVCDVALELCVICGVYLVVMEKSLINKTMIT